MAADSLQAFDDRVELGTKLIDSPEGGHGALLDASALIPERLEELDVAAGAGGGDLDIHAPTISTILINVNNAIKPKTCPHKTSRNIYTTL